MIANKNTNNKKGRRSRRDRIICVYAVIFIVTIWYILIGSDLIGEMLSDGEKKEMEKEYYISPCTQANFAKMIVYEMCEGDLSEIENIQEDSEKKIETNSDNEIEKDSDQNIEVNSNEDIEEEYWYSKYYSYLKEQGIKGLDIETANSMVDEDIVENVLKEVMTLNEDIPVLTDEKSRQYLSIHQVIEEYRLAKIIKGESIEVKTLVILETPSTRNIGAWKVITDKGKFGFEGLIIEPLKNKTVDALVIGDEILGITEIKSHESVLSGCKVKGVEDNGIIVSVGDAEALLKYSDLENIYEPSVGEKVDITLSGEGIIGCNIYKNSTESGNSLGLVGDQGDKNVVVGNIEYDSPNVRVVLTDGSGNYTHKNVELISMNDCEIQYGEEKIKLDRKSAFDVETFDWNEEINKLRLVPKEGEDSEIKILTIEKAQGSPSYRGSIEILKKDSGYEIVNEVNIEDYVAGVIPSEMPTSYGLEAIKVQAISARTYARANQGSGKFAEYNAQLDDTVLSQVYNNYAADNLSYQASEETKGEVLVYDGKLVNSKFFATSCGYTANYGEVWASEENFPSNTPPYMVSDKQYVDENLEYNMQDENDALNFFKLDSDEIDSFDEDSSWFRWNVSLTTDELSTRVNNAIGNLSRKYPDLIKVKKEDEWQSLTIDTIGTVQDMEVIKRGEGGNVMTLVLTGTEAGIKVDTEYVIRSLIAGMGEPGISVNKMNGKKSGQMSLLPSAFFGTEIERDDNDELVNITLYGGGFGHGVGMSQDGVKGMADEGWSYTDILSHYYTGAVVSSSKVVSEN